MTHIETEVIEKSSFLITVGTTFTPTVMTWRLADEDGGVVNSRSTVSVAVPSTSNVITLTSNDLAVANKRKTLRCFTVKGTYNGGTQSFADEATFRVSDLKGVS